MARYLIAGAAGFIGAKVSELLLDSGHNVVGIDTVGDSRVQQMRLAGLGKRGGFEFHEAQISDPGVLGEAIDAGEKVDAVFNLIAVSEQKKEFSSEKFVDIHIAGTQKLLELCDERGIKKFIQASTASVYGPNPAVLPILESVQTERLSDPVAVAEKSAESITHSYHVERGVEVTILRYFDVYGPGDQVDSLILNLCNLISSGKTVTVLGNGTQRKSFSYIDDVARGTIQGLVSRGYQEYNLGGHELISLNKLIDLIGKSMGKHPEIDKVSNELSIATTLFPDLDKARNMLGWRPEISLEAGMKNTVDWYISELG
jgi:UDP-glucuronate 4-epimerase